MGLFSAPYHWDIRGKFANGVPFHFIPGGDCATFVGERGTVSISRGALRTQPESLAREVIGPGEIKLYESRDHMGNFLDCIRTRRDPVANINAAVLSDSICQLSMIAIHTGRKIRWDAVNEVILDDPGASRLLTRPMRAPWRL
jgi:hypothetical protein